MKIQIEYANSKESWQIVVCPVSYMHRSHYYALVRDGTEWFIKRSGGVAIEEEQDVEGAALRNLVYFRAEMLCSLGKDDIERVDNGYIYLARYKSGEGEYERKPLPAEWLTLDGMAEKMPPSLMDSWLAASRQLNAGVLASIPSSFLAEGGATTTISIIDT